MAAPPLGSPPALQLRGNGLTILPPEDSLLDITQEVGESVATSWYGTIAQGELNELLADRPILPVEVDWVLLKDGAQRIGEYKTDLQGVPGHSGKPSGASLTS